MLEECTRRVVATTYAAVVIGDIRIQHEITTDFLLSFNLVETKQLETRITFLLLLLLYNLAFSVYAHVVRVGRASRAIG